MMGLVRLAVRNLRRDALRAGLTSAALAVAMLAFVLLRTTVSAWTASVDYAAHDRIATRHRMSLFMRLPKQYVGRVRDVPGVADTTFCTWFGARLPNKGAVFANIATEPESFLRVFDEIQLPANHRRAWVKNRRGALVGAQLARENHWKLGDKVILSGTIYPGDWEFIIEGIYTVSRRSIDQSTFWFHWDLLNESPALMPQMRDRIGWMVSRVRDASRSASVSTAIDALFEVSDTRTTSMSERALNNSFLGMVAALVKTVDSIAVIILVIMVLLLGNTIAMGTRERTQEHGVLRAIGFRPKHIVLVVLAESSILGLLGGGLGVAGSYLLIRGGLGSFMEQNFGAFLPYFRLGARQALLALGLCIFVTAVAGAVPAWGASRRSVIDSLRRVE